MNAAGCLAWCVEFGGDKFPRDLRTALHVRDWLADKAAQEATTADEWVAVETARMNSNNVIRELQQ